MTDETTNTEQNRVAADCPNERLVMPEPRFKIGTTYRLRGPKNKRDLYTVCDYISSFNHKGELIGASYRAYCMVCGQKVFASDVPESTIARYIINEA